MGENEGLKKIFTMPPGKAEFAYTVTCPFCGISYRIDMTREMYGRLDRYMGGEGHAGDMLPDLPAEIREMFISGMCPDCWNETFSGMEE